MNALMTGRLAADVELFFCEVVDGLREPEKKLPSKYLYDQRGSQLFDLICELDEYYPTRTELAIMRTHVREMAKLLGPNVQLIEYGSGSSVKSRLLLDAMDSLAAYIPLDISQKHLLKTVRSLKLRYPHIDIKPLVADFTQSYLLPISESPKPVCVAQRRVVYFPGSTIGNFTSCEAKRILNQAARTVGSSGGLLIGVDLHKDTVTLEAAYNDARGVTAAFNLNLLRRLNRELNTNFNLTAFQHLAFYNSNARRIEIYLKSLCEQTVQLGIHQFLIKESELILTEYSHKYTIAGFAEIANQSGFELKASWTDAQNRFAVLYFQQPNEN